MWRTLDPADWGALADALAPLSAAFDRSARMQVLQGHILRSARRPLEAAEAFRRALALKPAQPAVLHELGRCLRQAGAREAAIAALAAAAQAGSAAAMRELCRYGARAALPVPQPGIHAPSDYHAFATAHPVPPPPHSPPSVLFRIALADGRWQQHTLAALARQTYAGWHLADQPTPSQFAALPVYDLVLPDGAVPDDQCLGWLAHAAALTGSAVVRADHDHRDCASGQRFAPLFLPQPDFLWTEGQGRIVQLEAVNRAVQSGNAATIAHVPLVLLSLLTPPAAPAQPLPDADPAPLSVIIPTRDNPALLEVAVNTLLHTAARPDLIEVVIVDNGSRSPECLALFDRMVGAGQARLVRFDEPFNWSRANNRGAAVATGAAMLFLNDDTAMQTPGWDRILAGLLARRDVGLIGARMLYPDGTIQHGGFVFGMDNGPQHEGRWMDGADAGPGGRWTATRQAVGVTGAFMAMNRAQFEALGGFDEQRFAIDFADIDLCLRIRKTGKAVAYCGAITLTHHESVSRGLNLGRVKRRRMRHERATLDRLWGQAALADPGYHPVWVRQGCSYDGLTVLEYGQIEQHIRHSALPDPWRAMPDRSQPA